MGTLDFCISVASEFIFCNLPYPRFCASQMAEHAQPFGRDSICHSERGESACTVMGLVMRLLVARYIAFVCEETKLISASLDAGRNCKEQAGFGIDVPPICCLSLSPGLYRPSQSVDDGLFVISLQVAIIQSPRRMTIGSAFSVTLWTAVEFTGPTEGMSRMKANIARNSASR